jgi:hypothetical protein
MSGLVKSILRIRQMEGITEYLEEDMILVARKLSRETTFGGLTIEE